MPDYLIDTGPLIRHLRDYGDAARLLATLATDGDLYLSVISRVEVLQGMAEHERGKTYRLFDSLNTLSVDAAIADLAGNYRRQFSKQGVTLHLPDVLIAATAITHSLILVTYNRKDYPMPEIRLAEIS